MRIMFLDKVNEYNFMFVVLKVNCFFFYLCDKDMIIVFILVILEKEEVLFFVLI